MSVVVAERSWSVYQVGTDLVFFKYVHKPEKGGGMV